MYTLTLHVHSHTATQPHSHTVTLHVHSHTVTQSHSHTATQSLSHSVTQSLSHRLTRSHVQAFCMQRLVKTGLLDIQAATEGRSEESGREEKPSYGRRLRNHNVCVCVCYCRRGVEVFTLKIGMIQTGPVGLFSQSPLNKFQLGEGERAHHRTTVRPGSTREGRVRGHSTVHANTHTHTHIQPHTHTHTHTTAPCTATHNHNHSHTSQLSCRVSGSTANGRAVVPMRLVHL